MEYAYDSRGNILSKTYSDGTVISYGYNNATWKDRLTSYNGVSISSDTIGNPLSWYDGSAMTWQRGRQLATLTKNGTTISFAYNDEGIRTSKTVGNTTTNYSVVDGTLRRLTDNTNTLEFIYANGLSSVIFNGTEYWYVFNAQGDVVGLINANGEYVVEYTYDSWGKPLSKTGSLADTLGTLNPFRYRGYIYDEETGFYYVSSRYYDPAIGRWLNADAFVTTGQGFTSDNMFVYCGNNSVNRIDLTGEFFAELWEFGKTAFAEIGKAMGVMAPAYAGCGEAAVADGPLPFGDIVAAAGAALLTVGAIGYGIYQATQAPSISIPTVEIESGTKDIAPSLPKTPKDPVHHIVAKADPRAAEARQILNDVGIEPWTDPRNLVVLPQSYHVSLHTTAYHNYVTERLRLVAGDKAGVEATLASLKAEILARSEAGIRWD